MLLQQLFNGLVLGLIYGLIAVGYTLVFGILRLVNFSHGAVYAFGVHAVVFFMARQVGLFPAIFFGILLTGVLGIVIDRVALEPLRKKQSSGIAALITTIGVAYVIQNLLVMGFGSGRKPFPRLMAHNDFQVVGITISNMQVFMGVVTIGLFLGLTLLVQYTKIGLAMRAVEQHPVNASLMGISTKGVIAFAFFLGGISAAIAGVLVASYYEIVYPTMGVMIGLKAFSAAVLGGIGVFYGALVGGILIGLTESLAATWWGAQYRDAVAFMILIVVLIIRPTGLFGKKGFVKV